MVTELGFMMYLIYGENKSSSMAEACADKWKAMKKKSFIQILHMQIVYAST